MSKKTLGEQLKERRLKLGLTKAQLTEKMGITHRALDYIEDGKSKPSKSVMAAFSEALNIDIDEVVTPKK